MISTNQKILSNHYFLKQCSIFKDDESRFVFMFSCNLGHVTIYSDQKVKTSEIPSIMILLVNMSNGELSDPLCDNIDRGLTLVKLDRYEFFNNKKKITRGKFFLLM